MSVTESYRLSTQQRRHWAHDRDGRITAQLRTATPLDRDRAERALSALVARHETLRLRIGDLTGTGMPIQVVDEDTVLPVRDADGAADAAPVTVTLAADRLTVDASVLVADRESLALFLDEFAAHYLGTPPAEDPDRVQFLDVAEWQADEASSDVPAAPGAVTSVTLPHRDDTPADPTIECPLPDEDPEPRVLGAWLRALGRYLDPGAEPLAIAWYDSGRHPDGTTGVIGPLGCFVAIDLPRDADDTALASLLSEARGRSLRVAPLDRAAAAGFAMHPQPPAEGLTALGAVDVSVRSAPPATGLHLECVVVDGRLRLTLHTAGTDTGPAAGRMLLESVVAELSGGGAGPAETRALARWAGVAGPYAEQTLVDLLDDAFTAATGTDPAVIAPDGTLTFAELDRAADAIAGRLRERDVRPGDRVVVLGERSASVIAAFVGVLRAGAVYVPLDPVHPTAWLAAQARAVDAALVLGTPGGAALRALATQLPTLALDGTGPATGGEQVRPRPQDAAYIIFTSGSTGAARPVVVEHRNAVALHKALQETVYADAPDGLRVAVNASLGFDASVKQLLQLAAGRTLCLVGEETRRDIPALLDWLAGHRAGVLDCTPSHLRLILDGREPGRRLPELLLVGGEAVDEALWQELAGLDGVRAVNLYGPTECTVDATWARVDGADTPSIGRPLPGLRVHVVDPKGLPVPPGRAGELLVAGPQVARGYWADEEANAARFTEIDGARAYRTGDRVRFLEDGRIAYLGRLDDQIKINGHRLEPGEVAAALQAHPALARAVVDRRPAPGAATAPDRLTAYVVPRPEATSGLLDDLVGVNPHETRYLFDEIFVQRTYLQGGITLRENAVVLDVGANIGMFARFVDATCPGARILAFEPLPEPFELLRKNAQGRRSRIELFPIGLSDRAGTASFTVYPGYSMMSGLAAYADPAAELSVVKRFLTNRRDEALFGEVSEVLAERFTPTTEQVTLRRLSDVLAETDVTRVDLLKIDVQRAELDVLHGIDDAHLALVQQIALEVHDDTGGAPDGRTAQIAEYLRARGFEVVTEQDELLVGTDRHAVYAVRPEYRDDPRPIAEPPLAVPDAALLRQWAAQRLPEPFVPADVVYLDELPLTANGKLDRAALPAPGRQDRVVTGPATADERALVAVWEEVLGRTGIGVDDDFFALGGDSIRAIRMRAVAGRAGLRFPLRTVFRAVTIRALAAEITGHEDTGREPAAPERTAFDLIDPADREQLADDVVDAYPMTALQLAMVFHAETSPDSDSYHVVTVVTVRGDWAPDALRTAADRLAARHEALRTSFNLADHRTPLQLVHERVEIPCRAEDLSGLSESEREERVDALVAAEQAAHFDWRAPMLRLTALRTGPDTFELVQTHFHGVLDGLSLQLMTEELLAEYDHCRLGRQAAPAPTLPYRRYVEAELAAQTDEDTRRYWRESLAGVRPLLLAGTARPRMSRAHVIEYDEVPAEVFGRAAEAARVPVKSLLFTAHVRALAAASGRSDVVTGLVMNGRVGEEGGDRTLGLFLNTVPVPATAADGPADLWRAEQALVGHHALPLVDIQRCGTGTPLFDTFFNFVQFESADKPDGAQVIRERDRVTDVGFAIATHAEIADGRLRVTVQYDPDPVGADLLDTYAGALRAELDAAVAPMHTVEGPR